VEDELKTAINAAISALVEVDSKTGDSILSDMVYGFEEELKEYMTEQGEEEDDAETD
jgi:hypothetical protein